MNKQDVISTLRSMECKSCIAEVICDISANGVVIYPNERILVKLSETCDDDLIGNDKHWWTVCDSIEDFDEGIVYGRYAAVLAYCKHYVSEFKEVKPFTTDFDMNANLRKATNLFREFVEKNGEEPKFVNCYIRWKNDGFIEKVTIALFDFDVNNPKDDDKIFFYGDQDFVISNLANIDYDLSDEEFLSDEDFIGKVEKDAEDSPVLFSGKEDFVILSVIEYTDKLN